jgi:hypothetical protein
MICFLNVFFPTHLCINVNIIFSKIIYRCRWFCFQLSWSWSNVHLDWRPGKSNSTVKAKDKMFTPSNCPYSNSFDLKFNLVFSFCVWNCWHHWW